MSAYGETRKIAVAPVGAALAHALLFAGRVIANVGRVIEHRSAMRELGKLDDHMLRDIGITRHDLADAASVPGWEDPTRILVARAVERRTANLLAARENRCG